MTSSPFLQRKIQIWKATLKYNGVEQPPGDIWSLLNNALHSNHNVHDGNFLEFSKIGHFVKGRIASIKDDELPKIIDKSNLNERYLPLTPDEAILENAYFGWHDFSHLRSTGGERFGILYLEFNHRGPKFLAIEKYINHYVNIGQDGYQFSLQRVVAPDTWAKLLAAKKIGRVVVSVGKGSNLVSGIDSVLPGMMPGTDSFELVLKVARGKTRPLNAIDAIRNIFDNTKELKKLEVQADGQLLDLLSDNIDIPVQVPREAERSSQPDKDSILKAIYEVHHEQKSRIAGYYNLSWSESP